MLGDLMLDKKIRRVEFNISIVVLTQFGNTYQIMSNSRGMKNIV